MFAVFFVFLIMSKRFSDRTPKSTFRDALGAICLHLIFWLKSIKETVRKFGVFLTILPELKWLSVTFKQGNGSQVALN